MLSGWGRQSALNESEDIRVRYRSRVAGMPYDAKFIFANVGYNLRTTDLAAAFGLAQLKKLKQFEAARRKNFAALRAFFSEFEEFFVLPRQVPRVKTSWLAFPLTIRTSAPFSRMDIVSWLEEHNIQTRPIFTGNILKQPGFRSIPRRELKRGYPIADKIMARGFVIGCHHGLTSKHIAHIEKTVREFIKRRLAR